MVDHDVTAGKRTALYEEHVARGAKMVEFAGWAMPMFYRGIISEHRLVRGAAGLFDVSHMGEFIVSGPDALSNLERLMTNRVGALRVGRVQYTGMCYENGGFVDDLLIYAMEGRYMLVVNAANKEKDLDWIRSNLIGKTVVTDISDETALVALQGPVSGRIVNGLSETDLSGLPYYHWLETRVAGRPATVSRTGYTGEDGFEVYCKPAHAAAIWVALLEAGEADGVEPVGLGARDTLRLEMGYSLYGSDMGDDRTPAEAGLMWVTKLDKGDFIGRDAIVHQMDAGVRERIVGFELTGRGVPRPGHRILVGGEEAGRVTSGTFSPSLEKGIGLGYLRSDISGAIEVEMRGRLAEATTVPLPFYRNGSVKRKK